MLWQEGRAIDLASSGDEAGSPAGSQLDLEDEVRSLVDLASVLADSELRS